MQGLVIPLLRPVYVGTDRFVGEIETTLEHVMASIGRLVIVQSTASRC